MPGPGRSIAAVLASTVAALTLTGGPALATSPTWQLVSSPNSSRGSSVLLSVDCVTTGFCAAVGYSFHGQIDRTLIEQWNGSAWSLVSSPNRAGIEEDILDTVTCVGTNFCIAAGYGFNGSIWQTLIEQWNGTAWRLVNSPSTSSTQNNFIASVSCASSNFCAAVGSYQNSTGEEFTLAEQWNGMKWALVSVPNHADDQGDSLTAVSCVTTAFCRAVGDYSTNAALPVDQTMIEKWNGSIWSMVTAPDRTTTNNNILAGTNCVSTTACTAVGYYEFNDVNAETLIESSNGRSWSVLSSPNRSTSEDNILFGVSCVDASFCVADGNYLDSPLRRTLIETWNGTAWRAMSSPNRGSKDNVLSGVSCVTTTFCMAAGWSVKGTTDQTLIEEFGAA